MGVMGATPPAAQIEQYAATLRRRTGKAAARRGERGAAISADLFPALERYRGFRHVVRNVYAYVLDPRLMAVLISDLPETVACVRVKLAGFADGLDAIAQAAGPWTTELRRPGVTRRAARPCPRRGPRQ